MQSLTKQFLRFQYCYSYTTFKNTLGGVYEDSGFFKISHTAHPKEGGGRNMIRLWAHEGLDSGDSAFSLLYCSIFSLLLKEEPEKCILSKHEEGQGISFFSCLVPGDNRILSDLPAFCSKSQRKCREFIGLALPNHSLLAV